MRTEDEYGQKKDDRQEEYGQKEEEDRKKDRTEQSGE